MYISGNKRRFLESIYNTINNRRDQRESCICQNTIDLQQFENRLESVFLSFNPRPSLLSILHTFPIKDYVIRPFVEQFFCSFLTCTFFYSLRRMQNPDRRISKINDLTKDALRCGRTGINESFSELSLHLSQLFVKSVESITNSKHPHLHPRTAV